MKRLTRIYASISLVIASISFFDKPVSLLIRPTSMPSSLNACAKVITFSLPSG